jgi:hypothetical protein
MARLTFSGTEKVPPMALFRYENRYIGFSKLAPRWISR